METRKNLEQGLEKPQRTDSETIGAKVRLLMLAKAIAEAEKGKLYVPKPAESE